LLGVSIDPGWVEQLNRSLEGHHQKRARRKAARNLNPNSFGGDSDGSFAYIAGCTENGVPFGVFRQQFGSQENGLGPVCFNLRCLSNLVVG
jgi:hypothetical protein